VALWRVSGVCNSSALPRKVSREEHALVRPSSLEVDLGPQPGAGPAETDRGRALRFGLNLCFQPSRATAEGRGLRELLTTISSIYHTVHDLT
jgi:hypothetical protein